MFCSKCGNSIEANQRFCSKCGNVILHTPTQVQNSSNSAVQLNSKKANHKKLITLICVVISVILIVVIAINIISNIIPKRVDFDLEFDKIEIQKFMDIVCENADAEKVYVEKVKFYEYLDEYDCIYAYISVKPKGMTKETVIVKFDNYEDGDEICYISLNYNNNDTENEHTCIDIIVSALENSFCGKSNANEYTSQFESIGRELTIYDDAKIITDYSLTDEANVRISCDGSFSNDWTGTFCIYKN